MSLTACADKNVFGTLTGADAKGGGVCSAFPRPPYAIAGKTAYDQKWADETTEAGVAGCRWDRPAPRPADLAGAPEPKPVATPVKRHWYDHFRRKKPPAVQGG